MTISIECIDEYRWRIPAGAKPGMHVPAIIYDLLEQIRYDLSFRRWQDTWRASRETGWTSGLLS